MIRRYASVVLVLLALGLAGCAGREATFPDQPVLLICPWAAGGGTDRVARQLAVSLERELGVPVNVINATGASGVTGHTRGALARPDGHTLTLITAELNMLHWRGLTPITPADFQPLALLNRDPAAIFVRRDAPWQTLDDLNTHVRANPRVLKASGTALGGIWHVALVSWLQEIGAPADGVRWISIEGTAPSLQELMAGGVDIVASSLPEARALLEAGEIRALGVMADTRVSQFPEVPTLREQGVNGTIGVWRGVAVPDGTDPAAVAVLTPALERAIGSDAFRTFMEQAGFNWDYQGPDAFAATLADLDARFGAILRSEAFQDLGKGVVGPRAFPAVLAAIGLLTLVVLVATRQLGRTEGSDASSRLGALRVGAVLAGVLFYLVAGDALGFVLTAFAILVGLMRLLAVRWTMALVVAAPVSATIYQVFANLLRVPLPRGVFGW
jgi:tripartite-type tricarboxylate transporter receptor subunit TctC